MVLVYIIISSNSLFQTLISFLSDDTGLAFGVAFDNAYIFMEVM
jgi:hypothetical protein